MCAEARVVAAASATVVIHFGCDEAGMQSLNAGRLKRRETKFLIRPERAKYDSPGQGESASAALGKSP